MWPEPGKVPLENVDRAVLITVHHEATVRIGTAIDTLVEWHGLLALTAATHLARVPLIYDHQFFPREYALIVEHLHKAVESPIIVDGSIQMLIALFVLVRDHQPLGKITDHNGSLNQFVRDEMRCFMQTVLLFVALLL